MIREATVKLIQKIDLTMEETMAVINEIMSGETTPVQTAAFLTALQAKGTTIDEITACAKAMRAHALPVDVCDGVLEIVGTGGDKSGSFNISTTSGFVCAAGGCKVAKHGNRAATSKSGAADVLEALGANISMEPKRCAELLRSVGFCFLFAQHYHKAMKYVGPVRKELSVPTVFNILGPLTNPAHADHQILGVYDESLVEPLAHALHGLGVKREWQCTAWTGWTKYRRRRRRKSANSTAIPLRPTSSSRNSSDCSAARSRISSAARRRKTPRLPAAS